MQENSVEDYNPVNDQIRTDSDVAQRQSADATLKKNESYTASRNKFFNSVSVAENGKMLMTGMSSFNANNHMMLAKNNLKMMTH